MGKKFNCPWHDPKEKMRSVCLFRLMEGKGDVVCPFWFAEQAYSNCPEYKITIDMEGTVEENIR